MISSSTRSCVSFFTQNNPWLPANTGRVPLRRFAVFHPVFHLLERSIGFCQNLFLFVRFLLSKFIIYIPVANFEKNHTICCGNAKLRLTVYGIKNQNLETGVNLVYTNVYNNSSVFSPQGSHITVREAWEFDSTTAEKHPESLITG